MAGRPDYSSAVSKAEKAVEGIKDPELKRLAFERVLEDLLGRGSSRISTANPADGRSRAPGRAIRKGPQGYLSELIADGFFKKPKTIAEVAEELVNRGHHIPTTSLSGPLQALCQKTTLRRQKGKGTETKGFSYSDW